MCCRVTDLVVLGTIALGNLVTIGAHVLLKRRIDDKLLAYRMARKLPGELVAEARLMVMVGGVDYLVVVALKLPMVFDDGVTDGSHGFG